MSASNIAPAVELAIEEINRRVDDHEYSNFSIHTNPHTTSCYYARMAGAIAAEEYYTHIKEDGRVAAFLGPSCSGSMRGVAELSAVWGIPVLSGLATSISVSEKRFFKTLTRSTMILSDGYGRVVESLVNQFQWRNVAWLWLGTGFQSVHVLAGKKKRPGQNQDSDYTC